MRQDVNSIAGHMNFIDEGSLMLGALLIAKKKANGKTKKTRQASA